MATPSRDPAACEAAYEAWVSNGWNYAVAARATQMDRMTFKRHVWESESFKALSPAELPEGMEARTVSKIVDKQGQVVRQSVVAKIHPGDTEIADGMEAKAITIQQDGQGRITQQWIKKAKQAPSAAETAKLLREALDGYESNLEPISPPESTIEDELWCLPFGDWHIGSAYKANDPKLSWGSQDTIRDIRQACRELIDAAPVADTCLIQGLGDLCDYDGLDSITPRHKHVLETDMSHGEMLQETSALLDWVVDECRQKFGRVKVSLVRGNHDPMATQALKMFLFGRYMNEPRVDVDISEDPFHIFSHGQSLLWFGHGDDLKASGVPGFVAANYPKEWGKSRFRLAILGHRHHDEVIKVKHWPGMVVETLPAMVRSNRYAYSHGLISWRGMQSITVDKKGNTKRNRIQFT
jgi:hypothetical protein